MEKGSSNQITIERDTKSGEKFRPGKNSLFFSVVIVRKQKKTESQKIES